ncbi:MAG: SAM-dependent methyltransferase [Firmicutes bacterium]|nr:SAM-dependent methyltransferase [Bacillota bacterium]
MNMKLSERLNAVKEFVPQGAVVADIGADRGELSLELIQSGVAPKVILADISAKSLERAKVLFGEREETKKAEFRVGDGLKVLSPGEVDVAVFAGMGGPTICMILENSPAVVASLKGMIIQAMGNSDKVRGTLLNMGFALKGETMIEEEGQFYFILYAVPGEQTLDETELFAGPYLLKEKNEVLKRYLQIEKEKAQRILMLLREKGEGMPRQQQLEADIAAITRAEERMM